MAPTALKSPPSSSPASSSTRSNKRNRVSTEGLKRNIALFSELKRPLGPTLPPSPPQSRSSSPAPSKRRRVSNEEDNEKANSGSSRPSSSSPQGGLHPLPKRPRTGSIGPSALASSNLDRNSRALTPAQAHVVSSSSALGAPSLKPTSPLPVTTVPPPPRPKRRLSHQELAALNTEYLARARAFKKSGQERLGKSSTKPGPDERARFLSRMEMIESLVDFVYHFWTSDEMQKKCSTHAWGTIHGFLKSCNARWKAEAVGERQLAILGLIDLIEGCVWSRVCAATSRSLEVSIKSASSSSSPYPAAGASAHGHLRSTSASSSASQHPSHHAAMAASMPTPPSHASPANSSASPASSSLSQLSASAAATYVDEMMANATHGYFATTRMARGHSALTPAVLSRVFPKTWSRCMKSDLAAVEGHCVDPALCAREDLAEGEASPSGGVAMWSWPVVDGDHIVHLVGLAKSMIWELGQADGGYRGFEGIGKVY